MKKVTELLYSSKTTIVLLIIMAVGIGMATFIEDSYDTVTAKKLVYNAKWFEILFVLLAINFIGIIGKYKLYRKEKLTGLVFHLSFIIMILGAGITRYIGYEGVMHIREGEAADYITVTKETGNTNDTVFDGSAVLVGYKEERVQLPFALYLEDFLLERYVGSNSPSSYESKVILLDSKKQIEEKHRIYMNNVLDYGGFRFFQSSYDQDEHGTILSVNHDFWGTLVTYLGYSFLTLGFLLTLFNKNSRFVSLRKIINELREKRKAAVTSMLLLGMTMSLHAAPAVSAEHADRFGHLLVQTYNGRTAPVNTLAYDVIHKLTRKDNITIEGKGTLNAMQLFLEIMADPEFWKQQKIIYVREESVRKTIQIEGKYAAFADFFDTNMNYKLGKEAEIAYRKKQGEQNVFDKEIIKVSERLDIFLMVMQGSMLKLFPPQNENHMHWISFDDPTASMILNGNITVINDDLQLPLFNYSNLFRLYMSELIKSTQSGNYMMPDKIAGYIESIQRQSKNEAIVPSKTMVNLEIYYNEANIFTKLKMWYAYLSLALLSLAFIDIFRSKKSKIVSWLLNISIILLALAFAYHTFGMGLRWYLTGHAPWSNGYEALILIAWGGLLAGFSFMRYSKITLAATSLLAFFTLMTAGHSSYDPQLTSLVPVLKSYWLIIHVATLTVSYGFLGLGFLLGLFNLILYVSKNSNNTQKLNLLTTELTYINEMNLTIGLFLATIGCFLGGVWANESWGRYWGWDAKETWALVITIVYAIVLHLRFVPKLKSLVIFNIASVIAFGSVIMTFVGVNYYLSKGMHSYGAGDTPVFPIWAWMMILSVIILMIAAYIRENKSSDQ